MKKKAFVNLQDVEKIVENYETPFYLYDEKGIVENIKKIYDAFSWNKGFKEFFAVKACPNPFIIDILKGYNCGVDCSSVSELKLSEVCGFGENEIMFSSNNTTAEEFKYAYDTGAIINLDDFTHLDTVKNALGGFPKTMSCRYNPGGYFVLSNEIMDAPKDAKYGMTKEQLFEAYKILKAEGVESFGLHAFLASNTVTNDYYPALAKELFELVAEINEKLDIKINFVNLSGGIGIPYKPEQKENDIYIISEGVKKAYYDVLTCSGLGDVAIFTELGRFVLGPYGALVTKVINKKEIYKNYIGVDACAVNLMRPAMYGAYHHITVLGKEDNKEDNIYDVAGSLCENNDKFAIDRNLPKIEIGDYLFIHDAGAHGYAMGYNYNGKLKCAELLLKENGEVKLIRRAETVDDYFSTLKGVYKGI